MEETEMQPQSLYVNKSHSFSKDYNVNNFKTDVRCFQKGKTLSGC